MRSASLVDPGGGSGGCRDSSSVGRDLGGARPRAADGRGDRRLARPAPRPSGGHARRPPGWVELAARAERVRRRRRRLRVVTSDDLTIRARRAGGVELWSVDRGALGLTSVSELHDLPGALGPRRHRHEQRMGDQPVAPRSRHRQDRPPDGTPGEHATVDDLTGPILDNLMVPTLVATGQGALFALLPTQNDDGWRWPSSPLLQPRRCGVAGRAADEPGGLPAGGPTRRRRGPGICCSAAANRTGRGRVCRPRWPS